MYISNLVLEIETLLRRALNQLTQAFYLNYVKFLVTYT